MAGNTGRVEEMKTTYPAHVGMCYPCISAHRESTLLPVTIRCLCVFAFVSFPLPQFPEHPYGNLTEKLLLFRHSSNNSLVPLRDKENIRDGEIIEVVLSGQLRVCVCVRSVCVWCVAHSRWCLL